MEDKLWRSFLLNSSLPGLAARHTVGIPSVTLRTIFHPPHPPGSLLLMQLFAVYTDVGPTFRGGWKGRTGFQTCTRVYVSPGVRDKINERVNLAHTVWGKCFLVYACHLKTSSSGS